MTWRVPPVTGVAVGYTQLVLTFGGWYRTMGLSKGDTAHSQLCQSVRELTVVPVPSDTTVARASLPKPLPLIRCKGNLDPRQARNMKAWRATHKCARVVQIGATLDL